MKNNKKITVDELLEKVPNKYELAIACGILAREQYLNGVEKYKVIDKVFKKVLNDSVTIEE